MSSSRESPRHINLGTDPSTRGTNWTSSLSSDCPVPSQAHAHHGHPQFFLHAQETSSSTFSASDSGPYDSRVATGKKVAIPRVSTPHVSRGRRRSARACETCRQRKTKCDSDRPKCGQCVYHQSQCMYEDVKRVRDQKLLETLSHHVKRYENLLRELEGEVATPIAERIRKELKFKDKKSSSHNQVDGFDSSSSMGSLDSVDLAEEDLDRNDISRAAGFFGKNSEVSWLQRLKRGMEIFDNREPPMVGLPSTDSQSEYDPSTDTGIEHGRLAKNVPISMMNYHLDDIEVPFVDNTDPFAMPPRETADEYYSTYMTYIHPSFSAIRKPEFTLQYRQFFSRPSPSTSRTWLAILNMIFAIGCRYYRLISSPSELTREDDLVFLTRARQLSLNENLLFEHAGIEQVQLESMVAVYLICLGQVNRASKFSTIALRSAISLGINLRLEDDGNRDPSKEARRLLWWSIYCLEHLLTSMTGRASVVGESLFSHTLPVPVEIGSPLDQAGTQRLLQDLPFLDAQLCPTLFESLTQFQSGPNWATKCEPCSSLFFYYLVDLTIITQSVLNKVYSIEGVRAGPSQLEYRLQKYSVRIDRWLSKLHPEYQFTVPCASPWHVNHAQLDYESLPFIRERVCLAMNYYSARITLCKPCLIQTRTPPRTGSEHPPWQKSNPSAKFKADTATTCLQAACSLISVLPVEPNLAWLARVAPWWGVLHFLMQATSVLLLVLSNCSFSSPFQDKRNSHHPPGTYNYSSNANYPPLLEPDLRTVVAQTKKAFFWIHAMATIDPASRRAFLLCDDIVRKIAPGLQVDLQDWPSADSLFGGSGDTEIGTSLDGFWDLIDFDAGSFL